MIAYRLTFEGALRVSGGGDLFPRSDTLHAALCTALAALGEDAGAMALDPPFALSSLFPWIRRRSGEVVSFVPAPLGVSLADIAPRSQSEPSASTAMIPAAKAPRYLSTKLLARVFGAGPSTPEASSGAVTSQDGELWSEAPVGGRLWVQESPVRRAMDRRSARPLGPAQVGAAIRFVPDAGLYFLARPKDDAGRRLLDAGLAWLADEGFARSAPFNVEQDEHVPDEHLGATPQTGEGATMLLSLYLPSEAEVRAGTLVGGRYALVARGGVHASGAKRAIVNMVTEGAVVRGRPVGESACVAAPGALPGVPHAIHRCGRALGFSVSAGALQ